MFLGDYSSDGWIARNSLKGDNNDWYIEAYPSASYFIVTTFTTIGYGDFLPNSNLELILVMILELIGLAMFSGILGILVKIRSHDTAAKIVERKTEEVNKFMNSIDTAYPSKELPLEFFTAAHQHLDIVYKYGIKSLFQDYTFFNQMKPSLRVELIFSVLQKRYLKFKDIFVCEELGFQADDRFITQFLVHLQPQVFLPGKVIISKGEEVEYLYLVETSKVFVTNNFEDIGELEANKLDEASTIAVLPRYSFFGDYQIFLDTCSNVYFVSDPDKIVILYTIDKATLIRLCEHHEGHYKFFSERAIATRRLFQR
jgi:hypothetical protein